MKARRRAKQGWGTSIACATENRHEVTGSTGKNIGSRVVAGNLLVVSHPHLVALYIVDQTRRRNSDHPADLVAKFAAVAQLCRRAYVTGISFLAHAPQYLVLLFAGDPGHGALLHAYAFARMRFVGRELLFGITLATMLLPSVVTLIPTYVLFQRMGMVGTYGPLILPYFFGSAFNIFLLRQFMLTVPQELSDAAFVDGAGDFRILWSIMIPLVKPAIIVVAIFNFIYVWNDFLGPLLYLDDSTEYPFAIGLYAFRTRFSLQWDLLTAASLAITLPLIIAFFLLQRYFIEGVTMTGVKG
jgi:ABC-type Fe3+ transport system permease subunit